MRVVFAAVFVVDGAAVDDAPGDAADAVAGRKACGGMGGGLICVSTTGGRGAEVAGVAVAEAEAEADAAA